MRCSSFRRARSDARDASMAASALSDDVGWVVGRVAAYNDNTYAPSSPRSSRAGDADAHGAAGLVTWEPDAVIVRSDLLASWRWTPRHPRLLAPRPSRRQGCRGIESDTAVARRAVPTDGPSFWPSEAMRRHAAAADLTRARDPRLAARRRARGQRPRARVVRVPGAALSRGAGADRVRRLVPVPRLGRDLAAVLGAMAIARWACSRRTVAALPTCRPPRRDLRPTGIVARVAECAHSARAAPAFHVPEEPLLIAAIVATLAVTLPLFDRPPTSDARIDLTVAWTIVMLVVLWIAAVRGSPRPAPGARHIASRPPVAARLDVHDGRLVDASPGGVTIIGPFATSNVGDAVSVAVTFAKSDATVSINGAVAVRRAIGAEWVLGITLADDEAIRAAWITAVADATPNSSAAPTRRRPSSRRRRETVAEGRGRRVIRRAQAGPCGRRLAGRGQRCSRSFSWVIARSWCGRDGWSRRSASATSRSWTGWRRKTSDRATSCRFANDELGGESITHRVRSIRREGPILDVETRGDANDRSEYSVDAFPERLSAVSSAGSRVSAPCSTAIGRGIVRVTLLLLAAADHGRGRTCRDCARATGRCRALFCVNGVSGRFRCRRRAPRAAGRGRRTRRSRSARSRRTPGTSGRGAP